MPPHVAIAKEMKPMKEGEKARKDLADMQANLQRLEHGPRVLIIDDCMEDCVLLRMALEAALPVVKVDFAHSKWEANHHCERGRYDVIFLDLLFPRDSGLDIMRNSKCVGKGALLILVTGLEDDSALVKEAIASGAILFSKPISRDKINLVFRSTPHGKT
jgi:DNA-binding NtrC family response regulator